MTKAEFLRALEGVLELPQGSIRGDERLEALEGWDSLAVMGFIAMVDEKLGLDVSATRLAECATVGDLLDMVKEKVAA